MEDSHRKPLSAFMAVVMRLGSSSKTRPLLLEPQVHPDFFPDLPAPQKSVWSISGRGSAPRMLRGKLIPGGLARKGQRKCLAIYPSWGTTSCDHPGRGKSRAGSQESWLDSILSFPIWIISHLSYRKRRESHVSQALLLPDTETGALTCGISVRLGTDVVSGAAGEGAAPRACRCVGLQTQAVSGRR